MNTTKPAAKYSVTEVERLDYEIVLHMRSSGSVSWEVWYEYLKTPNAVRYAEIVRAKPHLYAMF